MPKPLKIPVFLQPKTKPYCGLVCIKMVASFFSKKFSLEELVARFPSTFRGIDLCSMSMFLISLGFKPRLFINMKVVSARTPSYERMVKYFIKHGGLLIPRAIKISDIRKALAKGCPVILYINHDKDFGYYGHYVVIKNLEKGIIAVNCPNSGLRMFSAKKLIKNDGICMGGAIIVRLGLR